MSNKICGVYKIRNIVNGKFYVGSSKDIHGRFRYHQNKLRTGKHSNYHLQHAWSKYGESSFVLDLVEECGKSDLMSIEQRYIDSTNCTNHKVGYNIAPIANLPPMTDETKKKIGDANRGRKPWILGKHHTEETKVKISHSNIGNHMTGKCGEKHQFFGRHHTEETKTRMRQAKSGKLNNASSRAVIQWQADGVFQIYPSAAEAERQTGIDAKNIARCLKGRRPSAGGFKWSYDERVPENFRAV